MTGGRTAVARARPLAPAVHAVLVSQNAGLAPSPARDAHLAALQHGAAAVVTGQQVSLFLGPLYVIYKAASAIALARSLAAETGTPVVPMFWLQTEDHDLPEIASCGLPGETLSVPIDAENRTSIAHLELPPEIDACVDRLAMLLGPGGHACAHVDRLRRHYRPGVSWARAFAGVLAELFAPEGLVVIDPRDPQLAAIAAPVHARAIDDAERIAAGLIARGEELERAGRAVPVHVRASAPLSFFHPEGALGPRVRLERTGDAFAEVGGDRVHTRAALLDALHGDPLRFSTSALLRPILQDTLLPTAAYVGGPAEVAYFAQLAPLYQAFEMAPPLVVPRARFRIVDLRVREQLARLGLTADDVERPEVELLARVRQPGPRASDVTSRLLDPFLAAHTELVASLPAFDRALARTRASVERAVTRLASKVERATLYADAELVAAIRRLRAILVPDGAPQERKLGLAGFAARSGDRHLVERVLAAVVPFDSSLKELS